MYTFQKEERLCSKIHLDLLFKKGSSFLVYPFRVNWYILPQESSATFPAQLVINVAKKRFKRAVDRNFLKRRIREAYRLHKYDTLYRHLENKNQLLLCSIHYIGQELSASDFIEKKLILSLNRLVKEIGKHGHS